MDIATLIEVALVAAGIGYLVGNSEAKANAEPRSQEVPIPIPVDEPRR